MQSEQSGYPVISSNPEFTAFAVGVVWASVCTSLPDGEATARLNADQPAGRGLAWVVADEPFLTGEPNGCPCEEAPETHRHLLFVN